MDITIRRDIRSTAENPLWKITVEWKGREYSVVYAGDRPSEEKVAVAFDADRKQRRLDTWQ